MTLAKPHHKAKALKPGSARPAKELCSDCGLCDTSYVYYVKDACAFINQQVEDLETQFHGRSRDLENEDDLYFGVHNSMIAARKTEPIEAPSGPGSLVRSPLRCSKKVWLKA